MIKLGTLIILILLCVIACDDVSNRNKSEPIPAAVIARSDEPVSKQAEKIIKVEKRVEAVRKKWLDTNISPDMIKDVDLYIATEKNESEIALDSVALRPPNKTQFMVTPKFFLKEDVKVKANSLDYLDGAAVQVEVKFE